MASTATAPVRLTTVTVTQQDWVGANIINQAGTVAVHSTGTLTLLPSRACSSNKPHECTGGVAGDWRLRAAAIAIMLRPPHLEGVVVLSHSLAVGLLTLSPGHTLPGRHQLRDRT